jgi:hypothetical protein
LVSRPILRRISPSLLDAIRGAYGFASGIEAINQRQ